MKNMKSRKLVQETNWSDKFYGAVTVGERGQIVIPAEARADMNMLPGEKILIMQHPVHEGLILFKIDAAREFIEEFAKNLDKIAARDGDQS